MANLTKREVEMLSVVAEGKTSLEAAGALCVSKRTVDFHLTKVYEKLGVRNRIEAINAALTLGLITI